MHIGIQSLFNELTPDTSFERYKFGDLHLTPMIPANLYAHTPKIFQSHLRS